MLWVNLNGTSIVKYFQSTVGVHMFVVSQIKRIKQRTIALLTSLSLHLLDEVTFLC